MSTTTGTTSSTNNLASQVQAASGASKTLSASEQTDRFLKLLVTQMQNQDPLNPMDNAEITTQMAQISTVSGIDDLNKSIGAMSSMLLQSQSLEAAGLVGKTVLVNGNDLTLAEDGSTAAGFELAGPADSVKVQIKNAAGKVVDTLELGAAASGRHSFEWQNKDPKQNTGFTFTVTAMSAAKMVESKPLVADGVAAVYNDAGQLSLETFNHGVVKYADVKGIS
ncbi:MAG: flagellar hook assembly protein FlgD [Burkholderiales bacterium]|nr:flagellar hook assembly protein FlgD [Burkholderiales bacterium]